jgi:nitrogen fixation protein FixH
MPKNIYPALIIFLLGAFLLFLGWSAMQASTQGTQITDRDYYSKGLKYNSTLVEKKAASSMGWQLTTEIVQGKLQFQLFDGNGKAVSGAVGYLHLYSRPDSDQLKLVLQESVPGSYLVGLPASLKGEITVRVEFERDGARINRQLLINI